MAHTGGPWAIDTITSHIVSTTEFEDWSFDDEPPQPKRVICFYGAMGGDDNQADLALLAAAPELLQIVKRLVGIHFQKFTKAEIGAIIDEAHSILAKAQPRT